MELGWPLTQLELLAEDSGQFCDIEFCEAPATNKVLASAEEYGDRTRKLCGACKEAYAIGVQHAMLYAQQAMAKKERNR
jgi:hypothetical protein